MGPARSEGSGAVIGDVARALLLAAERLKFERAGHIVTGSETLIRKLAEHVERVGFEDETVWDVSKPYGQLRRFLGVGRAREVIGFVAGVPLEEGLRLTVASFRASVATAR